MDSKILAQRFVDFVNSSPSHFHAVFQTKKILETHGFTGLKEREPWDLSPNGKYYFTRNNSTLFAFTVGAKFQKEKGFKIIGSHTDSPVLKLKPNSKVEKSGFLQVGVQLYGGGIWHTWFDRDLTVAGRVITKDGDKYQERLVYIDRPILRIPTLCIHLDRNANEAFKFDKETKLIPVLATSVKSQLLDTKSSDLHHSVLLQVISQELSCLPENILDLELNICDHQKSVIGGALSEFIFSPRIDNLASAWCSLMGLVENDINTSDSINMIALFDSEEIGSETQQGASSNMMIETMNRILNCTPTSSSEKKDIKEIAFRNSILVSADMAHAVHPNYSDFHESNHQPKIHSGPVIKENANQRYATDGVTKVIFSELAKENSIPLQFFVIKNSSPCGSTIGPILATGCGIKTIDIGAPQLSMHSIREMCGVDDMGHYYKLMKVFFEKVSSFQKKFDFENIN